MLLFRSEEHLEGWLANKGIERGATMTLTQQAELARKWYSDRLDDDWQPRAPESSQAILESVGLTSDFWKLT